MGRDRKHPSGLGATPHVFTLYVAGIKPASRRAVENLRALCRDHLHGGTRVTIIDLAENPQAAHDDDVVAIPTLVKSWPLPRQIFVGDLSQTDLLLSRLVTEAT